MPQMQDDFLEDDFTPDDFEVESEKKKSSFLSRLGDFGSGLADMAVDFYNPTRLVSKAPDIIKPFQEIGEGKFGSGLSRLAGFDPDAIKEDWQDSNYSALAGDILPQVALGILTHKLGGGNKPKTSPVNDIPIAGKTSGFDLSSSRDFVLQNPGPSTIAKHVTEGYIPGRKFPDGTLEMRWMGKPIASEIKKPGLAADLRDMFNEVKRGTSPEILDPSIEGTVNRIKQSDKIISDFNNNRISDTLPRTSNLLDVDPVIQPTNQKLLPTQPKLGLPAQGETSFGAGAQEPRFYQGKLGTADANVNYGIDLADPLKTSSPFADSFDTGHLSSLPPEVAAERGLGRIPGQVVLDPNLPTIPESRNVGSALADPLSFQFPPQVGYSLAEDVGSLNPFQMRPAMDVLPTGMRKTPFDLPEPSQVKPLGFEQPSARNVSQPFTLAKKVGGEIVDKKSQGPKTGFRTNTIEALTADEVRKASTNLPKEVKVAIDSKADSIGKIASKVPEIVNAVPEVVEKYAAPKRSSTESRFAASMGSSIENEIGLQSPYLGNLVKQVKADWNAQAGKWINKFNQATDKLSDKEFQEFVSVVEGKNRTTNERVNEAVRNYKLLDKEVSDIALNQKINLVNSEGDKIAWQPRENYWPHMYDEKTLQQFKVNPEELRSRLRMEGKSETEIDQLFNRSKRFGERLIDSQHAREAELPGYRTDRDVYKQHLMDMARRVEESKAYGNMDLADPNSPLMQAIKQTKNPDYTARQFKNLLNRNPLPDQDAMKIVRAGNTLAAWIHLSLSGIGNLASKAMTPIVTDFRAFANGLKGLGKADDIGMDSGVLMTNIFHDIVNSQTASKHVSPTKLYGLEQGEQFMRTVSARAGQDFAKRTFDWLKKNPESLRTSVNKSRLQELVLDNVDEVLKQPELTAKQLDRAAFRAAELSQGAADKQVLPEKWTSSALGNALSLFHRYAFSQTRNMKNLIKQDPLRTIPLLLTSGAVAGEVTGDVKSAVQGLIDAGINMDVDKIPERIEERGKWWNEQISSFSKKMGIPLEPAEDALIGRLAQNYVQAFTFGLWSDLAESSMQSGQNALMNLTGVWGSDLAKGYDAAKDIGFGLPNAIATGETKQLKRGLGTASSFIPFYWWGIKEDVYSGTGRRILIMPIKSPKQFRLMEAARHGANYGPSKKVAEEFLRKTSASKKKKFAKS